MYLLEVVQHIVRKYWLSVGFLALAISCALYGSLGLRSPKYLSTAVIKLNDSAASQSQNGIPSADPLTQIDAQHLAALTSPQSALEHLWWKQFELSDPQTSREELVRTLLERIELAYDQSNKVVLITATAKSAHVSAALANAFAGRAVDYFNQQNNARAQTQVQYLEGKRAEALEQIHRVEQKLQSMGDSQSAFNNSIALKQQIESLTSRLADIATRRLEAETTLASRTAARAEILSDTGLDNLEQQLTENEQNLEQLTKTLGPKHPQILELEQERDRISALMDARADRSRISLEAQASSLQVRERAVQNELAGAQEQLEALKSQASTYESARAELDSLKEAAQWWATQSANAATSTSQIAPFAAVQNRAIAPAQADNALHPLAFGVIFAVALVIGCLLRVGRALSRNYFISIGQLEQALSAKTLAQIPLIDCAVPLQSSLYPSKPISLALPDPAPEVPHIAFEGDSADSGEVLPVASKKSKVIYLLPEMEVTTPDTSTPLRNESLENAFRQLRGELLLPGQTKQRVFTVTSTSVGEGKSTVACNLAYTLAKAGYDTLLIDVDVLHPARTLRTKGIADLLHQSATVSDIVYQCALPFLYTISAGNVGPDTKDLLYSKAMAEFVEKMRQMFDYVVLDAPCMEESRETLLFSELSDTTLYVVDTELTSKQAVRSSFKQLRAAGRAVAGIVVNRFAETQAAA